MVEPTFEWVCTYCDAFGTSESPEMAQLAVEIHLSVQHPHALEPDSSGSQEDGPGRPRTAGSD
jgi:hypothetical protein